MQPEPTSSATKYIVGIIIIGLMIVGVSLAGRNKTAPDTQESTEKESVDSDTAEGEAGEAAENTLAAEAMKKQAAVEIDYTDANAFTPDSVTIKAGDTVKFVNKSSSLMWVASNPHPFHTDYPGLDENEGVTNGGVYQFTFTKTGSWGYHNHKNPRMKGVVVVQ